MEFCPDCNTKLFKTSDGLKCPKCDDYSPYKENAWYETNPRHDWHNCGCSACQRIAEREAKKSAWNKKYNPDKYRREEGDKIKAWVFLFGIIWLFVSSIGGGIFFGWAGGIGFFIFGIIILVMIFRHDFSKDVKVQ